MRFCHLVHITDGQLEVENIFHFSEGFIFTPSLQLSDHLRIVFRNLVYVQGAIQKFPD